jgi:hypothetical protein
VVLEKIVEASDCEDGGCYNCPLCRKPQVRGGGQGRWPGAGCGPGHSGCVGQGVCWFPCRRCGCWWLCLTCPVEAAPCSASCALLHVSNGFAFI